MTLQEWIGVAAAALGTAAATFAATKSKLERLFGKPQAPGDDNLRDLMVRLDGKLDVVRDNVHDFRHSVDQRFDRFGRRLAWLERSPPFDNDDELEPTKPDIPALIR